MQEMSRTDNISIVASLLGFLLAVYGIFTQPVGVESARPTQTGAGEPTKAEVPAYARLWDDPFAVYSDIYNPHPPDPKVPKGARRTLFLVIPTKTFAYEEDKENRLRIRYAVERALFDHGFVARSGNLISTIDLTPSDGESCASATSLTSVRSDECKANATNNAGSTKKISAPVQIFAESPWPTDPDGSTKDRFSAVVVVWLPDSYVWTANQSESCVDSLWSALRQLKARLARPEATKDEWILFGPSDSDALAFFKQYSNAISGLPMKLVVVPYRATIAESLLDRIVDRNAPFSVGADPRPDVQRPESSKLATTPESKKSRDVDPVIRFPNGDDVLCLELLRAVKNRKLSRLTPNPLHVLVLAEWDTLYGRALAETFTALADRGKSSNPRDQETYHKLKVGLSSRPDTRELLSRMEGGPTIEVHVLPYLRGLDGASTLYRRAYDQSVSSDSGKSSTTSSDTLLQKTKTPVEAAEGTTQFDYIRRLIESDYKERIPFLQRRSWPDAIILFGTDVYDKLALLEFLRQELRSPLYLTTDLDALYWHPHYLKFTKNLVVASPFPLRMNVPWSRGTKTRGSIMKSVEFRDIH
jgi:hypothetical protein